MGRCQSSTSRSWKKGRPRASGPLRDGSPPRRPARVLRCACSDARRPRARADGRALRRGRWSRPLSGDALEPGASAVIETLFESAVSAHGPTVAALPDGKEKLEFYAFFKQATEGDVAGDRPA
ncbi:hypothetical protein JL722_14436 [Aureococcus anophagefferens]|nr:hypothetical protein JL722_14436 [Aureococcus anophagefferens]